MVCLDTPTSRATSSTARPASTCFKAAIISASLCLLRDMLIPLSFDEIIINFVRNQGSRSVLTTYRCEKNDQSCAAVSHSQTSTIDRAYDVSRLSKSILPL